MVKKVYRVPTEDSARTPEFLEGGLPDFKGSGVVGIRVPKFRVKLPVLASLPLLTALPGAVSAQPPR